MNQVADAELDPLVASFLREARDAVHNVRWYLGCARLTKSAWLNGMVAEGLEWHAAQARRLMSTLRVPASLSAELRKNWDALDKKLGAIGGAEGRARIELGVAADLEAKEFLTQSLVLYRGRRARHLGPNLARWLRRHLAGGLTLLASVLLCVFMPQLSGLLAEAWEPTALFSLAFVLGLFGPAAWAKMVSLRKGKALRPDVFGDAFRAIAAQASPPRRRVRRWGPNDQILKAIVLSLAARGMLVGVFLAGTGGLAWVGDHLLGGGLVLTVWGGLALFYVLVAGAFFLDFWAFLDGRPVRPIFVGVAILTLALMNGPWGMRVLALGYGVAFAIFVAWGVRDRKRKRRATAYVAWLGAGVCALALAYLGFTEWARDREAWENESPRAGVPDAKPSDWVSKEAWLDPSEDAPVVVMIASGGGSRAAIYTAHTLEFLHHGHKRMACALRAISSVSGGSLANAAYMQRRWFGDADLCPEGNPDEGDDLWGLVDAVAGDFIAPTMEGVLSPGETRGTSLEEAWRKDPVGLQDTTMVDLANAWRAAEGHGPLPLLNTVNLERHAVVMSPLAHQNFVDMAMHGHANAPSTNAYAQQCARAKKAKPGKKCSTPTWVFYRDAIYGLDELLPKRPIALAEAVRASANFPFGFPLVELQPAIADRYSPDAKRRKGGDYSMFLTDGGTLSNSGIWSMFHLLRNHATELKRRGVVLIVVEASHMPKPGRPGRFTGVWDNIADQRPLGQGLHRTMLRELRGLLGSRFQVVQVDLSPDAAHNVHTTWALPRRAIERLDADFQLQARGGTHGDPLSDRLTRAWELAGGAVPSAAEAAAQHWLLRPPVD